MKKKLVLIVMSLMVALPALAVESQCESDALMIAQAIRKVEMPTATFNCRTSAK